jgi:hypothetical protein
MTVEEAKGVCKDRSKWKEVILAYPKGKRDVMYVCIIIITYLVFITEMSINLDFLKRYCNCWWPGI